MSARGSNVAAILALSDEDLDLLARVAAELPLPNLRSRLAAAVELDTGKGHTLSPTPAREHARALLLGALDALWRST